jgi:hypothetical protein
MNKWLIIKGTTPNKKHIEYQVSDGLQGSRTTSYDFTNYRKAKAFLDKLNKGVA